MAALAGQAGVGLAGWLDWTVVAPVGGAGGRGQGHRQGTHPGWGTAGALQ